MPRRCCTLSLPNCRFQLFLRLRNMTVPGHYYISGARHRVRQYRQKPANLGTQRFRMTYLFRGCSLAYSVPEIVENRRGRNGSCLISHAQAVTQGAIPSWHLGGNVAFLPVRDSDVEPAIYGRHPSWMRPSALSSNRGTYRTLTERCRLERNVLEVFVAWVRPSPGDKAWRPHRAGSGHAGGTEARRGLSSALFGVR